MGSKLFTKRSIIAAIAVLCLGLAQWKNIAPLQWVGLIFYLTCLGMYGKSLYNTLFKMRKITADLLLVTVMTVSLAAGEPLSGALVAWFISMGLAIAFSIIERTGKKINALTRQTKKTARRMEGDGFQEVPVGEIQAGDRVMVPCGEMIPVDGKVIQGSGDVDESVVTGEPFTVLKAQGDKVLAGSVAVTAPLTVEADKPGDHGFVYALAREMEKALKNKPQIHRRADQIVQFFIGGVVIYAFGVFVVTGWMAVDGKIEGFIAILDQLKEEAQGLGGRLRNLGVKQVTLATGDSQETEAQRVAQGVAADHFHWGLAPADKQRLVKELKEEGITLMAGDGVNDST
ncbi:MAG: HAD family hydrolase, partial [Desulfovibrionales bacterium]|nr:HAD family hydrolase [Desulfovibrionales bacterium]